MDYPTVLARLNDLPRTFKRQGGWYAQLVDSIGLELADYTLAADATSMQVQAVGNALDGWLDVWGLLWGVPRIPNEANSSYATRIERTVLAWVGTLPALQAWVNFYAPGGSVTENASGLGYVIAFPASMTGPQVATFLAGLARIRPAGVPFAVVQQGGGLFLGTDEFLGTGILAGSYLTGGNTPGGPLIGASTPNSVPLLPTLYFSDPLLGRPGLLALAGQGAPVQYKVRQAPLPRPLPPPQAPTFWSNGGVLTLINPALLPESPLGLAPATFWSNDGNVSATLPVTPVSAPPLFFYSLTLAALIATGPAGLPQSNPGEGTLQIWLNGGEVSIA
jgi:hypothetical protein